MSRPIRILLIGNTGRIDCLAEAFVSSSRTNEVYALAAERSPGLLAKCKRLEVGQIDDVKLVEKYALAIAPDFVFIGPEQPLAAGVVDVLMRHGFPSAAPTKNAARIETSKLFARQLLTRYGPRYNPEHRFFSDASGLDGYMRDLQGFVIKPNGLTGGKGVKVLGDHFHSRTEGLDYCNELFSSSGDGLLIEEKLDGEEFSIQSFCDGTNIAHSPPVQDHKRAHEGDKGPNTGGIGSYSCADHCLPFLSPQTVREAQSVNELVFHSLMEALGEPYRGILYGNFMSTGNGLKVIEYNARFGDPEVMNILPLLRCDFIDVCEAMLNGGLRDVLIEFKSKHTVCKWVVPNGYPTDAVIDGEVDITSIPQSSDRLRVYFGAINEECGRYKLAGSRAIAFLGIGDSLAEAEQIAERAASAIRGPVQHRRDIGTNELVQKRVRHMNSLLVKV